MARINIEECWWSDPRRTKLIELLGAAAADSAAVNAWRLAQEFWSRDELVPAHIWKQTQANAELIQANLAEEREDGIYVRGSSQYLSWVMERRRAASRGGKKSAEKLSKKAKQTSSKRQANASKREQTQPSGSGSISGSSSDSGSGVPAEPPKANAFVAAYCERFKARWGENPDILPQHAGIAKRLAKGMTLERFRECLDAYFSMPDAWLVKTKHPLNAFETKLNEITVFIRSGAFHTQRQARDADNSATNAMLLQKIERGEI